jgi:hypothetical protein
MRCAVITEIQTSGIGDDHNTRGLEPCQQAQENDVAKATREVRDAEAEVDSAIGLLSRAEGNLRNARQDLKAAEYDQLNKLSVSASTTAGFWPHHGYQRELVDQPIEGFLSEAKTKLQITDVTGWVARVGDQILKIDQSYHANGFAAGSDVIIDWGPEHGGGGTNA